jgi:drug/metabolite transporter (DMT)-like permease
MEDNKSNIVLQAILWALLSSFASGIMVNLVRLASETVSIPQIIFVRNFFAFTIFIPFILYKGVNSIKTEKLNLHILRSITGVIAMMLFFYGISKMNLSLVTAISFTAPLIAAIFAYMAFNDKPGIHRIIALIIGFIGALIVIRPGFEDFDPLSLVVLLSAVFWAGSSILIKKLSNTDSAFSITFYMTIFMMVFYCTSLLFLLEGVKLIRANSNIFYRPNLKCTTIWPC